MDRNRGDRDRERDHDRDRDRSRDRDRYAGGNFNHPDSQHQPRRPSRFSDGPPGEIPANFLPDFPGTGGAGGPRRAFESPPRHSPGGGFPPVGGGGDPGGFRPMVGGDVGGGRGGGFGNEFQVPTNAIQLSGQKRGFPYFNRGGSQELHDGRSFVKLFVGSVPRTATEEEIRPLFEKEGKVLEVAFIKDKRTGQQQGCCFIKYGTSEEAERAIRGLHNQYTLPGGIGPIQVRYADGERERLTNGTAEYKLFVGSLNKHATPKEVEEIFSPYGPVEDVYLMRDEMKQSRGCGFVKFSSKDSAMGAINALNGIYLMTGCDQPLTVRFADPKRPRAGEQRNAPAFGGPDFGPLPPPGMRPPSGANFDGNMGGMGPSSAWRSMSPQNLGPSNAAAHGFGNPFPSRRNDAPISSTPGGHLGPQGSVADGSVPGAAPAASTSPQYYNQSFPQAPPSSQQISPLQKPLSSPQNFPTAQPLHHGPGPYSQTQTPQAQTPQASLRPPHQLQTGVQASYNQAFPSIQPPGYIGQSPPSQFQGQQSATSAMAQHPRPSMNLQPNASPSLSNSHQPIMAPQQAVPFQHSPSPLAQMLSQQTQTLQATYQSSQQAISQLQQQVQMMQPSNQNQSLQQNYQATKQQSPWVGVTPTTAATTAPSSDTPSTSSVPTLAAAPAPAKCTWTEHTSPDGYKYYYNSATAESRWVKPEELALYEQQQKLSTQPPQNPSILQAVPSQQVSQSQAPQFQTQFHQTEQYQHPSLAASYQVPKGTGNHSIQEPIYTQQQAPANSQVDTSRFQQGFQANQEWAWRSNSGGT